jgi:hypothetical protein
MKRRIKHNDLTAWFLEDHATLPASYVKSCQEFFDEISKRQATSSKQRGLTKKEERLGWITRGHEPRACKRQASSNKRQAAACTDNKIDIDLNDENN